MRSMRLRRDFGAPPVSRLALGTVQFGLPYGISREGGKVPAEEVEAILRLAAENSLDTLDTGAAYGDSEKVLGEILGDDERFAIVTKTTPIRTPSIDRAAVDRIEKAFFESLRLLRRRRVSALLVHDARDILNPGGDLLWARLEALRDRGLVGKLGVSVYDGEEIDAALLRYPLALVQAPLSVFDQRLIASGRLERLAAANVEVHARSAFLQGLLLMDAEAGAAKAPAARGHLAAWREAVAAAGTSALSAALGLALSQPAVGRAVIGVHSAAHLAACLAAVRRAPSLDYASLACPDLDVIDPRRWKV
jgi:aryl-alcohol dehydrogenase-like predicted oxidoreductase